MEFEAFPKIPRLNRDIIITEKIDGTNAAILIEQWCSLEDWTVLEPGDVVRDGWVYRVAAQSRKRLITPGKDTDNFGFAAWVRDNAERLILSLGEGRHFGEWWGHGIARGYGLPKGERRFSLFNVDRYSDLRANEIGLDVVPELYRGPFRPDPNNDPDPIRETLWGLKWTGSAAADFDRPEGIIVYHVAARQSFKVTLEGDEAPKGSIHWGGDGV